MFLSVTLLSIKTEVILSRRNGQPAGTSCIQLLPSKTDVLETNEHPKRETIKPFNTFWTDHYVPTSFKNNYLGVALPTQYQSQYHIWLKQPACSYIHHYGEHRCNQIDPFRGHKIKVQHNARYYRYSKKTKIPVRKYYFMITKISSTIQIQDKNFVPVDHA